MTVGSLQRIIITTKMNSFNDGGPGEPEQDANSALIELDKGKSICLID